MADTLKDIFGDEKESLENIFSEEIKTSISDANALPEVAEAAGSIAGSMIPGIGGIGASAGGAAVGRAVGEVAEDIGVRLSPTSGFLASEATKRQVSGLQGLVSGPIGAAAQFAGTDKERAKDILIKSAIAGGSDLAFGVAGGVIGGISKHLSRGISRGLFGRDVADRFLARPNEVFGKLKEGLDAPARKVGKFFKELTNRIGGDVESVVKQSKKFSTIDNQIKNIADQTNGGATIEFLDIPKMQKKKISELTQEIASYNGKEVNAETVWNLRKGVDSLISKTARTSEARPLLYGIRDELSGKLKTYDSNISKVFKDYTFAKESSDELGKYYKTIETPKGEVISQNLERFTKNLLKSDKGETIRLLQAIDEMVPSEKKIAEEILDIAASEGIARDIGGGVLSRVVLQNIGGSQNIAKFLAAPSSLKASVIEKAIRAAGGTGATAALTRD